MRTHLQSHALLAPVELEQLLAPASRRLHGTAERRVEQDERRARHEVDEDDAEPEVHVEVDMHVVGDERREVRLAADDRHVWIDERRQLQSLDSHLDEARQLRQQRRYVHTHDYLRSQRHPLSRFGVTSKRSFSGRSLGGPKFTENTD